mmetsp:Transcript_20803/g.53658  ORF Transcript_20803/g.53658 Transcript_20803/m.53658 type:complete len:641 (-) Transcript_20803:743-2665(-)
MSTQLHGEVRQKQNKSSELTQKFLNDAFTRKRVLSATNSGSLVKQQPREGQDATTYSQPSLDSEPGPAVAQQGSLGMRSISAAPGASSMPSLAQGTSGIQPLSQGIAGLQDMPQGVAGLQALVQTLTAKAGVQQGGSGPGQNLGMAMSLSQRLAHRSPSSASTLASKGGEGQTTGTGSAPTPATSTSTAAKQEVGEKAGGGGSKAPGDVAGALPHFQSGVVPGISQAGMPPNFASMMLAMRIGLSVLQQNGGGVEGIATARAAPSATRVGGGETEGEEGKNTPIFPFFPNFPMMGGASGGLPLFAATATAAPHPLLRGAATSSDSMAASTGTSAGQGSLSATYSPRNGVTTNERDTLGRGESKASSVRKGAEGEGGKGKGSAMQKKKEADQRSGKSFAVGGTKTAGGKAEVKKRVSPLLGDTDDLDVEDPWAVGRERKKRRKEEPDITHLLEIVFGGGASDKPAAKSDGEDDEENVKWGKKNMYFLKSVEQILSELEAYVERRQDFSFYWNGTAIVNLSINFLLEFKHHCIKESKSKEGAPFVVTFAELMEYVKEVIGKSEYKYTKQELLSRLEKTWKALFRRALGHIPNIATVKESTRHPGKRAAFSILYFGSITETTTAVEKQYVEQYKIKLKEKTPQ